MPRCRLPALLRALRKEPYRSVPLPGGGSGGELCSGLRAPSRRRQVGGCPCKTCTEEPRLFSRRAAQSRHLAAELLREPLRQEERLFGLAPVPRKQGAREKKDGSALESRLQKFCGGERPVLWAQGCVPASLTVSGLLQNTNDNRTIPGLAE